jgi:hypothetical protein
MELVGRCDHVLHDVSIQPAIILSTPDHIEGALPLIPTPRTGIKIHGNYLDTRIRNTSDELAEYPEQLFISAT